MQSNLKKTVFFTGQELLNKNKPFANEAAPVPYAP